jgi:hypothetical protein
LESIIVIGHPSKSGNRLNNLKIAMENMTGILLPNNSDIYINIYWGKEA